MATAWGVLALGLTAVPGALAVGASLVAAELTLPTGKNQAVQEAIEGLSRDEAQSLIDTGVGGLQGSLSALESLLWAAIKIGAVIAAVVVGYGLWRRYWGPREVRKLLNGGAHPAPEPS